mgnify:CR=1 FL=1
MNELLKDWMAFCEGKEKFDKSHFYTLFYEDIGENMLVEIFKYFPNADKLVAITTDYLFGKTEKVEEDKIENTLIELSVKDIAEKKKLLANTPILQHTIEKAVAEFTPDCKMVEKLRSAPPYSDFFDAIRDELSDRWIIEDKKAFALHEAFYGLTTSYELVWYLFSPLFSVSVNFEYYNKFTALGGVYSFSQSTLLVSRRMR